MLFDFALVAAGLALLLIAGDLLVRGAVAAGVKLNVPAVIIGLTIVAFGTSAPELFVTVQASLEGAPGIAVGNVIGSNIANVLLVLGLPALFAPLGDHSSETRKNYLIMLGVTAVAVALCMVSPLTWWQGALLLAMLGGFLAYNYRCAFAGGAEGACAGDIEELEDADPNMPNWKVAGLILLGLVGLPVGADLTVDGARSIASDFGLSEAAIGLTLVALGTSLPELATTLMAAMRNRADVAIGNVIGSNVFNLLCILGVAASLDEIVIPPEVLSVNLWIMAASAAALAPFIWMKVSVGRAAGGAFVAAYAAYIVAALGASTGPDAALATGTSTPGAPLSGPVDAAAAPVPVRAAAE